MKLMPHIHDGANASIEKEKEKQEKYWNANKREIGFELGEQVWKRNMTLSSAPNNINAKLLRKFMGPYTINERLGGNVYRPEKDGNILRGSCHANDLKKFSENTWEREEARRIEEATPKKTDEPTQNSAQMAPKRRPARPRKNTDLPPAIQQQPAK